MKQITAQTAGLGRIMAALVGISLLGACDLLPPAETPLPQQGFKPTVTIVKPANGSQITAGTLVPISATAEDASGVLRVDFLVNGQVIDSQTLFVASRRFDYQATWRPKDGGAALLTIIAYNVNHASSEPVSVTVAVSGPAPTLTQPGQHSTPTPFVVFVTTTPPPTTATHQILTPIITVVTVTPLPSATHQIVTPIIKIVTATPLPTLVPTSSPAPVLTIAPTETITHTLTPANTTNLTPGIQPGTLVLK